MVPSPIHSHPGQGLLQRFARYEQPSSGSSHTNSSSIISDEGGGDIDDEAEGQLVNQTIHLLDFLSQLIINQDHYLNKSMELTFEETMAKLDSIIAQLDQRQEHVPPQNQKTPRLDSNLEHANEDTISNKYHALVQLKDMLKLQFKEYSSSSPEKETESSGSKRFLDPHDDESLRGDQMTKKDDFLFDDINRLTIPLVGPAVAQDTDKSTLQILNQDSLNIMVKQAGHQEEEGEVSIFPTTENEKLKRNISEMIGVDFDTLIEQVSKSVGEVQMPLKVEEYHVTTQVNQHKGQKPFYKYTETVADVEPSNDPKKPSVNVVSKKYTEGDLFGIQNQNKLRWVQSQLNSNAYGDNAAPSMPLMSSHHGKAPGDVKVNVTTKTNIVNVFTFNIFFKNSTDKDDFTLERDAPMRSNIQTTANIATNADDGQGDGPVNSISLYQYKANEKSDKKQVKGEAAELEKWLKILLNHQAYGDGSNIVAEAVLKDASLQQIPEARTALRRMDEEDSLSPLGYKTDMNGDVIVEGTSSQGSTTQSPPKARRGLIETLAGSPIPTILAGIAAVSPAVLTVLGGKKRRKRSLKDIDIPDQWLSFLLGTRYGSTTESSKDKTTTTTTMKPSSLLYKTQEPAFVRYKPMQLPPAPTASSLDVRFEPLIYRQRTTTTTPTTTSTPTTTTASSKIQFEPMVILSTTSDPVYSSIVSKRNAAHADIHSRRTANDNVNEVQNPVKADNLMRHWTALYKSVKTNKEKSPVKYYFPVITTPSSTTTRRTTTLTTESTTTSSKLPLEVQTEGKWNLLSTSFPPVKESFFPHMNPIKIIDEAVAVSTSTSTEVNVVPSTSSQEKPAKPVKSTNVPPSLWLTAKDILNNLGTKLAFDPKEEISAEMTNSPIVIIPVEDESGLKPQVNVQALKPIVSQNPITFINMSARPKPSALAGGIQRVEKPPSKLFVESYFAKNNVTLLHKKKSTTTSKPAKIITFNSFSLETSTAGLRKPSWQDLINEPNRGIGQVQELQIPVPVNIVSDVVKTDLTPEVLPALMEKLDNEYDYSPIASPEMTYGESSSEYQQPSSYESYDEVPNNHLVDTLKMQLKNSPLTHAIDKGQWVYA